MSDSRDPAAAKANPDPERRGVGEWLVLAVLVLMIAGVAWSQFGALFQDEAPAGPRQIHMGDGSAAEAQPTDGEN